MYNKVYYKGMIAVLVKKVDYLRDGRLQPREEISMLLLLVSHIQRCELETILNFFHVNIHEWVVCQICDSCSVNICIAELMGIPHTRVSQS